MRIVTAPHGPSILAIAAHPDDIESWCAGTIAASIDAGATVRLLLVTSGDKGSGDPHADPAAVGMRREAEARVAAQILGIEGMEFLRVPDGETENTLALRRDIVRAIRTWKPEVVFTHDPEHPIPPYLSHRDHRVVGRAALDAIYPLARDPLSFPELSDEGITPHDVQETWLFASANAGSWVDIHEAFPRKLAARLAHESQTPDPAILERSWADRFRAAGEAVGVHMAEGFTVLRL